VGTYTISLLPNWGLHPVDWGDDPAPADLERSDSSVFYLTNGNLRQFIYKYPDARRNWPWPKLMAAVADTPVGRIGVALPAERVGREIHHSDSLMIPAPESGGISRPVRFFPAYAAGVPALQIRYELPPTQRQLVFFEEAAKFSIAIGPPALALWLLHFGKLGEPRRRRRWIWTVAAIELLTLASFVYLAFASASEVGARAAADVTISIIANSMGVVAIWKEKQISKKEAPDGRTQSGS
jgi:hypothetical protein